MTTPGPAGSQHPHPSGRTPAATSGVRRSRPRTALVAVPGLALAALTGLAVPAHSSPAVAGYRIVVPELPVGTGGASITGLAENGRFVGTATEREGGVHALAWDGAGALLFDSGAVDEVSGPFVADSGYVAYADGRDAWLWNPRRGSVRLDDSGARSVTVLGVNRTGQVLGRIVGATTRTVVWTPGTAKPRDVVAPAGDLTLDDAGGVSTASADLPTGPDGVLVTAASRHGALAGTDADGAPVVVTPAGDVRPGPLVAGLLTDSGVLAGPDRVAFPLDLTRTAAVPTADTWTSSPPVTTAVPAADAPLLSAGGPQHAVALLHLRVPAVPAGAQIVSARLKLRTGTASYAGSRELQPIHLLGAGWKGQGTPAAGDLVLGAQIGVLGATGPNADVTADLDVSALTPGKVVDLVIGAPGTDNLLFASLEASDPAAVPRVLLSIR